MKRLTLIVICLLLMVEILGATDYHPSARHYGAGNGYHGTTDLTAATAVWYAGHYDFIGAGLVGNGWELGDTLYACNPNIMTCNYTNLIYLNHRHTVSGSNYYVAHEYHELMHLYDSASIPAESAFVHYGGSKLMASLSDGERYFNLDSLRTAGADSCIRVSLRTWNNTADSGKYYPAGVGDWFCNITSPTYRTFRAMTELFIFEHTDSLWGETHPNQYGFADNYGLYSAGAQFDACPYWLTGTSTHTDSSKSAAGNWTTSTDSVDWDIQLNIHVNQVAALKSAYISLAAEVQDSLQAHGFKGYIFNVGPTDSTNLAQFAASADPAGLEYEFQGDNIYASAYSAGGGWNAWNRKIRGVHAANASVLQLLEFRFASTVDTSYANAKTQSIAGLAIGYCIQEQDSTVLLQVFELNQNNYFEAWMVDIGWPTGAVPVESTVTDLASKANQKIIFRPYDNGLAIWRPLTTAGDDTTAASGYVIHLGKQMYQIGMHADSTLLSDSTITVKAQHGYILQDAEPPTEPIISRTPAAFTFSATAGGSNPANQTLNISNSGAGTMDWVLTDNAAWLSLGTASGENTGSSTVIVDISGLTAGTYNATITITDVDATNNPQTATVALTVNAAGGPSSPTADKRAVRRG